MVGDSQAPTPAALPFWPRSDSLFDRLLLTTFIRSSHLLAMPSTLAPCRLRLAATLAPRGLNAPG